MKQVGKGGRGRPFRGSGPGAPGRVGWFRFRPPVWLVVLILGTYVERERKIYIYVLYEKKMYETF